MIFLCRNYKCRISRKKKNYIHVVFYKMMRVFSLWEVLIHWNLDIIGPGREKTWLQGLWTTKTMTNQPVHPRSLISAFVIHFLESIISKLATSEIPVSNEPLQLRRLIFWVLLCWKPQRQMSHILKLSSSLRVPVDFLVKHSRYLGYIEVV